jgi:hypothetical protein
MKEFVGLKLRQLLEADAPKLTPEEEELRKKLQLWAKQEHQGEVFRYLHILAESLGFGRGRALHRRDLRGRTILVTVAVSNERAAQQDPLLSPESPGRHGSIIQLARVEGRLALDSMTFEQGKPVLYGDPVNRGDQEIGYRYVQHERQQTETVNFTNTPGEQKLCHQIEQWVQRNLHLHTHRSFADVPIDLWHEVTQAWDFSEPFSHQGIFAQTVDPMLTSDPIEVIYSRSVILVLSWFPLAKAYILVGNLHDGAFGGRLQTNPSYYMHSRREGQIL